ncbi:MAG: metal-dependent transcriptional regulator [Planctomycetia bacterium]|nr:MAG: metal-dependent transcriptional regulator [Planctomycetia bacterium]
METWKEFEHNVVTHSAAHHLMAVDDLVRKLGYARVSDVARVLGITRGSVSVSLQPLKEAGLVQQDENRHLRLSAAGQSLVDSIKTKRHVVQRLFAEVLGVSAEQAEIDACKLEHLLSNETARRLVSFLRFVDRGTAESRRFFEALRSHDSQCSHEPSACPSCPSACLADTLRQG